MLRQPNKLVFLILINILLLINACSESSTDTAPTINNTDNQTDVQASQLIDLENQPIDPITGYQYLQTGIYYPPSSTSIYYKLIMTTDGQIDFATLNTDITLFDTSLNQIAIADYPYGNVMSLTAGEYIVLAEYVSSLSRSLSIYSPVLFSPNDLTPLQNGEYRLNYNASEYYKLTMTADGNISFSTQKCSATVFDTSLNHIATSDYPSGNVMQLTAGEYVVKFRCASDHEKYVAVFSPLLN